MSYEFQGMVIPHHMLQALTRYVEDGIEPGGFLTAVICNDLTGAIRHADHQNIRIIPAYVAWLYNEAPSLCWGSGEKMDAWMEAKRREALARREADVIAMLNDMSRGPE
jgi:hypothetical protein